MEQQQYASIISSCPGPFFNGSDNEINKCYFAPLINVTAVWNAGEISYVELVI
jgi:hypothetical protein